MKILCILCALWLCSALDGRAQMHGKGLGESAPSTAPEPTADYIAIYQSARKAYDEARFDDAEQQVQIVLGKYPHYAPAASLLAMIVQRKRTDTSFVLRQKLDEIVIPRVNFKDATVEGALNFLRDETRRLDPQKRGVNFVPNLSDDARKRKITLDLIDVTAADLLKFICEVANLHYRVERSAILISSEDSPKPLAAPAPSAPAEPAIPTIPGAGQ